MNTILTKSFVFLASFLITLGLVLTFAPKAGAGVSSISSQECTVTTHAPVAIGASNSSTILAASARRAWAFVQRPENSAGSATSTLYLTFDEGTAATAANGRRLSTSTPEIAFGLNADFPYTGAVTGIASVGSTTVHVTECVYQ